MEAFEAIRTRRSIRAYEERAVPDELVEKVLQAAMMAPSARNAQPWHFVVIDARELLSQIPQFHPNAAMAAQAPMAILVCADLTLELSPGYWPIDCAAAVQNLLLAAHALGLGAVWTGVYPREERMLGFQQMFGLPDHVIPHTLVPLGYPAEQKVTADRYRSERVHRNAW